MVLARKTSAAVASKKMANRATVAETRNLLALLESLIGQLLPIPIRVSFPWSLSVVCCIVSSVRRYSPVQSSGLQRPSVVGLAIDRLGCRIHVQLTHELLVLRQGVGSWSISANFQGFEVKCNA